MLKYLATQDVGPAKRMELNLAPRVNLLTGDNGLGKTFLLDIAWWALTRSWAGPSVRPRPGKDVDPKITFTRAWDERGGNWYNFVFREQSWWSPLDDVFPRDPGRSGIIVYARVDGSFSTWDSARCRIYRTDDEIIETRPYNFTAENVWNGITSKDGDNVICNGLIRDWVTWQYRQNPAFQMLTTVLKVLSPRDEELRPGQPTRVRIEDVRDIPTLEFPYETVPVTQASAGMKRILALAYLLVWTWYEHREAAKLHREEPTNQLLFIFDEIEAHLHPQWQRVLLPALLEVAKQLQDDLDIQILATTHSPMVLASVEPEFDEERDALFTFDLAGSEVELKKLDWRPRGDASSWLTSEVFDLKEARSLQAERAIQAAMEAMRRSDLSLEEARDVHHELHAVLKETDPFWPRWLARAKAAGVEP